MVLTSFLPVNYSAAVASATGSQPRRRWNSYLAAGRLSRITPFKGLNEGSQMHVSLQQTLTYSTLTRQSVGRLIKRLRIKWHF